MDINTVDFYDNHAQEYINQTNQISMQHIYESFLPLLPPGGHILDAGCGSCRDSAFFYNNGFQITAFDASLSLVKIAQKTFAFPIHHATFASFITVEKYDGIWASASMLHLQKAELQPTLARLKNVLKPNGVFYCSFKINQQSHIDSRGRFFTDMSPSLLKEMLMIYFNDVTTFNSQGVPGEVWCNAIGR